MTVRCVINVRFKIMKRLYIIPLLCLLALSGCSWINKSKAKELPPIQVAPQIQVQPLWSKTVGDGTNKQYLLLTPSQSGQHLFVDDAKGHIIALDANTGHILWKTKLKHPLTTGPRAAANKIFVGTGDANVVALDDATGKVLWQTRVPNQVLARPGYAAGRLFVKTIDGQILALDADTGKEIWAYGESLPTLILRGGSSPVGAGSKVVVGFANGKLTVLNLNDGLQLWERSIARPEGLSAIQQMIDIDADPIVLDGIIYVATYQGNLQALRLDTGDLVWEHKMSTYGAMAHNDKNLFVTDSSGHLWAFDLHSGLVLWRQNRLADRQITGPALVGNELVVGDDKGNLYWVSQSDGRLMAKQVAQNKIPFYSQPVGLGKEVVAINSKGKVFAYAVPA